MLVGIKNWLFGKAQDPFSAESRKSLALVAFLAWVGLGADGLSSSCYGPQLGFLALHQYQHLALFLALLTAGTVFLIALSYNQVIELFPNGGGGYKVANVLLGPHAGLFSGTALIIDYMLTIAISIASGVAAVFSLLPPAFAAHQVLVEVVVILFLMLLNLRGMKESIKFLLPIFLGFFITHLVIIGYGIFSHGYELPKMLSNTVQETHSAIHSIGFIAVFAFLLRAYSLGSGTYTGLEAVSNNVNMLAEPRVRTGRMTMLYMAISLSVVASGIILLYLLWDAQPVAHMTLNAVVFQKILGPSHLGHIGLIILLAFEAGLLVVGGNTGFLGGPAVLSNMAQDDWVPRRFGQLSSRLVKQNGVLFFGLSAALIIILTEGSVMFLVVLYAINVFITFSISLLGLAKYWVTQRDQKRWLRRFILSSIAFLTCIFILFVTIVTKFSGGSWVALLMTGGLVALGYVMRNYYSRYEKRKDELDRQLEIPLDQLKRKEVECVIKPELPTAVFIVKEIGAALHTLLWVERMFPKHFKNYVFVSYGEVDTNSFGSEKKLNILKRRIERILNYLVKFSENQSIPAVSYEDYGADSLNDMVTLAEKINKSFPNNVYFSAQYVSKDENVFTRFAHSDYTTNIQRHLQAIGIKMLTVPLVI